MAGKGKGGIWAIVPVKHLSVAKSRLAPVLGEARAPFMRLLARRTVSLLTGSGLFAGVLVVTSDAAVAADARAAGASTTFDWAADLNDACLAGIEHARAAGAEACMLVHADLALLDQQSLADVVSAFETRQAAVAAPVAGLVRCKEGSGTTIAIFGSDAGFTPSFGANSFERHMALPSVHPFEIASQAAAFDVDTPADLDLLAGIMPDLRLHQTADTEIWTYLELNDERDGAVDHAA
ncbi:2-phospho-L-lactate guanylyltransferase [Sphingobium faniae]|nr:2-phospho-L-lactate guanylyltransferase [Sphingobium faniae]